MAQLFDSTATCLRVADDVIRFYDTDKQESYCNSLLNLTPIIHNLIHQPYYLNQGTDSKKGFTNLTATKNTKRRPDTTVAGTDKYFPFKAASRTWHKYEGNQGRPVGSTATGYWKTSTKTDLEKNSFIRDVYTSFSVSSLRLTGNTLHLYFEATRGMPELYGNGDMRSGQYIYKETNSENAETKTCYRDADGIKNKTFFRGWEEREYKVTRKNGKNVWGSYIKQTGNVKWSKTQPTYTVNGKQQDTKVKIFYKVKKDKNGKTVKDKNGNVVYQTYSNTHKNKSLRGKKIPAYRRGYKYVPKYYWSPIVLKDDGTIYCKSFNKIGKIVSYKGFKGNINNELIGTISFVDKQRRIKALRMQGFSNEGASKSGVSTFFTSDPTYQCAKCGKYMSLDHRFIAKKNEPVNPETLDTWSKMTDDEKTAARKNYNKLLANYNNSCHEPSHQKGEANDMGNKISFKLYLSALDNRKLPTVNLNGHINLPVLLNVDNYKLEVENK